MSEKRAKNIRKNEEKTVQVQKKDKGATIFTIVATVVIVAVLVLGIIAIIPQFNPSVSEEQQVTTVGDVMAEDGLTLDEFKAEYGLSDADDITEESDINLAVQKLDVVNYAKYTGTTVEELKAEYSLGDEIADDMLWVDVIPEMTTGVVGEKFFGMDFENLKTAMGFPEEITADTKWGKTSEIMTALYEEQQSAEGEK